MEHKKLYNLWNLHIAEENRFDILSENIAECKGCIDDTRNLILQYGIENNLHEILSVDFDKLNDFCDGLHSLSDLVI